MKLSIKKHKIFLLRCSALIPQNLIVSSAANKYFDILIDETNLDKEFKNLMIYKKGLFNADHVSENLLIKILNPLIKQS